MNGWVIMYIPERWLAAAHEDKRVLSFIRGHRFDYTLRDHLFDEKRDQQYQLVPIWVRELGILHWTNPQDDIIDGLVTIQASETAQALLSMCIRDSGSRYNLSDEIQENLLAVAELARDKRW